MEDASFAVRHQQSVRTGGEKGRILKALTIRYSRYGINGARAKVRMYGNERHLRGSIIPRCGGGNPSQPNGMFASESESVA